MINLHYGNISDLIQILFPFNLDFIYCIFITFFHFYLVISKIVFMSICYFLLLFEVFPHAVCLRFFSDLRISIRLLFIVNSNLCNSGKTIGLLLLLTKLGSYPLSPQEPNKFLELLGVHLHHWVHARKPRGSDLLD